MVTSNCFGLTAGGPACVETLTVATSAVVAVPKVFVDSRPMLEVILPVNGGVSREGEFCV